MTTDKSIESLSVRDCQSALHTTLTIDTSWLHSEVSRHDSHSDGKIRIQLYMRVTDRG